MPDQEIPRSLLFVPGNRPELFAKAARSTADTLVLDLEDGVPAAEKARAQEATSEALAQWPDRLTLVRVRHPALGELHRDIAVLAPHTNQVVLMPKTESAADVAAIDHALGAFEQRSGLAPDCVGVMVVIESCAGLQALPSILGSARRIRGASLATAEEGDLMADLGGCWTPGGEALHYARGKLVADTRAARLPWLVDGPLMQFSDDQALRREAELARTFGFNGKVAIHPRQVATINDVFSPAPAQIERAEALIAAYQAARAAGHGVIKIQGMMVDEANVRRAERLLARRPR